MKSLVQPFFLSLVLITVSFISSAEAAVNYTGVNLAGAEFGENSLPGTYGTDYTYPTHAEVDYFTGKRMNVFRLPFLWERLQRTPYADFDAVELARIDDFVNYATGKGASVVLDPHNYARYYGVVIGTGNVPAGAFADFWSKLASRYKTNGRVIFGLMNEPHDMTTELWRDDANAAIQAIRNAGAGNLILVPGNGYTGAHSWNNPWYGTPNAQAMLGINDPGNNYAFEVHQYLDVYNGVYYSGQSDQCISTTIGSEKLAEFTSWLRQNGRRGFLGEFAGGRNNTCYAALDNMLTYVDNNADVWLGWTYWAAGPWWGEYMFTLEPANGTDRPQMSPLSGHLAGVSGGTPTPTPTPTPAPSSGTGLRGDYYNSVTPAGAIAFTRTDATVNFDWGSDPGPGVGSDNFSVRWTGQVQPLYTETYTFYTVSDDGVRLWVNGTQVVNNWTDHPATENSGTVALTAGQRYDIRMEFYEHSGGAVARLSWSSQTQAKQIIPASQLYPATTPQTNPPLVLDDFESGALGKWNMFAGPGSSINGGTFSPGQTGNYGMSVSYSVTDWAGIEQLFGASRSWAGYNYLDFWVYGGGSGNRFRVELYDNGASAGSAERFEYQFTDDVTGWRHFTIPLSSFTRRGDWQPSGAPNDGLTLTQMWGFNFSPLGGSGSFKADQVQLTY